MGSTAPADTGGRAVYLDNLRAVLVALVVFGHAWAGYAALGSWTYTSVREGSLAPATVVVAEAVLGPYGLFAMGFFFLIAGLLTPGSVDRKGAGRFARDRLLRLGIPLVVFTVALEPPLVWVMDKATGHPARVPFDDPAQLWFVEVLLLYSLGYAAWRWWRPAAARPAGGSLRLWYLLVLAGAVTVTTFLARLRYRLNSDQVFQLHLWQWPQYLALFGLGVVAARRGWLRPVPDRLRRACGTAAVVGILGIAAIVGVVALGGVRTSDFFGGWHWAALATATAEGLLAVTLSVCLLGSAQRRLNQRTGTVRAAATRGAYAAYVVQGHVLVGLALVVRPLAVPVELKATVVGLLGVPLCFALGWLLTTRTPLRRVL